MKTYCAKHDQGSQFFANQTFMRTTSLVEVNGDVSVQKQTFMLTTSAILRVSGETVLPLMH